MVSVLTPLPIDKLLTYRWQGDEPLSRGTLVEVEVGLRRVTGCVWQEQDEAMDKVPHGARLKDASPLADAPRLNDNFMAFLQWMAHWSYNQRGLVLKMALGERHLQLPLRKEDAQRVAMKQSFALTPSQQAACDELARKKKGAVLLDGVTGSGKTLVYMELLARKMAQSGQILVLLPEIALLPQWLAMFEARFGFTPLTWHSQLTRAQRRRRWLAAATGQAAVIVGTRSALFLPMKHLALIVVDEEHDTSYKQEQGVIYHGRDMAIARARHEGVPVVLASATPSLETLSHVASGKYETVVLQKRYRGALATIRTIDMRRFGEREQLSLIAPPLVDAIAEARRRQRQCLLFVNRRGYAPLLLCRACGHKVGCSQCDSRLVWHELRKRLLCHYCGAQQDMPSQCPECGKAKLRLWGMGVERLAEEARALFPDETIRVISSDHMAKESALQNALEEIRKGSIGIVIGTQMMAKGHHFPHLGLAAIMDADMSLASDDLRAAERCYQMVHQVGGRAGREHGDGVIYVQSYQPDNAVLRALCSYDRSNFVALELKTRAHYGLPPYGRLAALIVSGVDGARTEKVAKELARVAPRHKDIQLHDAVPAPIFMIAKRKRWRLLLSTRKPDYALARYIRLWLAEQKIPSAVQVKVDIDPIHFL